MPQTPGSKPKPSTQSMRPGPPGAVAPAEAPAAKAVAPAEAPEAKAAGEARCAEP